MTTIISSTLEFPRAEHNFCACTHRVVMSSLENLYRTNFMTRFTWTLAIFLCLLFTETSVPGVTNHEQVSPGIKAFDKQRDCHLEVRKIFDGDTDRGMEASLYNCAQSSNRDNLWSFTKGFDFSLCLSESTRRKGRGN